jgi:hypothetical protein
MRPNLWDHSNQMKSKPMPTRKESHLSIEVLLLVLAIPVAVEAVLEQRAFKQTLGGFPFGLKDDSLLFGGDLLWPRPIRWICVSVFGGMLLLDTRAVRLRRIFRRL